MSAGVSDQSLRYSERQYAVDYYIYKYLPYVSSSAVSGAT